MQKEQSDRQGRKNTQVFAMGDQVLLNAKNLPTQAVSAVGSTKLRPRFVVPFTVIGFHDHAYTLDLPSSMATHPTFYVGLLKPFRPAGAVEPVVPTESPNTDGRRSPSSEQALPREAGQEPEQEQEQERVPLRGVPPGLQATHPIVQSVNPVKVPLQALTRLGIVLLAFRTSCPQPDSLLVKLPRQIPHEISQKVQVPADILEPLQAGLRILNASAKRRHVRPLAIQQSLTRLHTGEKALQVRTGASWATLSVQVGHHSRRRLRRLCLVIRVSSTTMSRGY
ncbi:hypothetical protein PF008_g24971 [Phytophthora fragariae]|uniref:Tf2-1-like SH3-like domain-containing protein n=1 Tax=Phytophthora fragariae TaxID=53985 RepID=A0A6G0QLB6_9STRA|nr:hypothetical protein PF008_g24971 [Phytophthora fragariae]